MAFVLALADYVVIGIMLSISAGVGIYFRFTGGRQKTTLEFLMADKNMSIVPVLFSILATMLSAIFLLGSPAEVYLYGAQMLIRQVMHPIAIVIITYCILPIYFEMNANSIYEYLGRRFGKVIKFIASVLYSVQMILYMAIVIYAPSLALSTITGLSSWTCVISIALVCTFYSTLGGLKAVLWTDLFQGFLMLLTIYALIIKGSLDFGGFHKIFETAEKGQRLELFNTSTDFTVRYTFWNVLVQGVVHGLYLNATNFSIIQRLISCGSIKKAQRCLLWSIPLTFLFYAGVCFLGITMYSYYNKCDPIQNQEVKSADQLVPLFILKLFGHLPGLPGLCIAGIFSAVLSTMSSILNSLAAVTLEDYIRPFTKCTRLSEARTTLMVKLLALLYGGLSLFLTFVIANAKGLLEASTVIIGMVGGPNLGVFCLGMFTSTANETGAVIGIITGFALHAWIGFGSLYNKSKYPTLPLSSAGCALNVSAPFDVLYKENSTLNKEIFNFTTFLPPAHTEKRYTFILYKISYIWIPVISFLSTVVAGYIASYIIGLCKTKNEIDPRLYSPVVRNWLHYSSVPQKEEDCIELPQGMNKALMNAELDEDRSERI